jgi:hypothetical protein
MTDSRTCPHCGKPITPEQTFCGACGSQIPTTPPPLPPEPQTADALRLAGPELARAICLRCQTPIAQGAPIIQCHSCHHVHHHDCYMAQQGCATPGCPANPLTHTQPTVQPVPSRSNVAAIAAAVGALLLAALGVAVAVILASGGSTPTPTAAILATATGTISVQAVTATQGATPNPNAPTTGATNQTAPPSAYVGTWRGQVVQYTPSGTRQEMSVLSHLRLTGSELVGDHSETTLAGKGQGQRCAGTLVERQASDTQVVFDYTETLNPDCISHTAITLSVEDANVLNFYESYQTNIGPGHLSGVLSR